MLRRYSLGMTSPVPQDLLDSVVRALDPLEVWLFGSHARGEATDTSDLDLFVVVDDHTLGSSDPAEARRAARNGYEGPLDLLIASRSKFETRRRVFGTLAETIDHEGVRIYVKDEGVNPAHEMLESARKDVRMARLALSGDLAGPASFHVQQAWEKYLKARLIEQGVRPRKVHKLGQLLEAGRDLPEPSAASEEVISSWAVASRYPDDSGEWMPEPPLSEVQAVLTEIEGLLDARAG